MGRHDEVEDGMGFAGLCSTDATEDRCWKELGERNQQLIDAKAEIETLKATLTFYAKPENWKQTYIASRGFSVSETLCDGGRMARTALGLAE